MDEFLAIDPLAGETQSVAAHKLRQAFQSKGLELPKVIWSPSAAELPVAPLPFLLTYWQGLPRAGGLPVASALDPLAMQPALGHVSLLDPLHDGNDFYYRLYGSEIARRAGFDLTGRRVSDLRLDVALDRFLLLIHRNAARRRCPVFVHHVSPAQMPVSHWDRLVLPMADEDGRLSRLLVGDVPGAWRSTFNPELRRAAA